MPKLAANFASLQHDVSRMRKKPSAEGKDLSLFNFFEAVYDDDAEALLRIALENELDPNTISDGCVFFFFLFFLFVCCVDKVNTQHVNVNAKRMYVSLPCSSRNAETYCATSTSVWLSYY